MANSYTGVKTMKGKKYMWLQNFGYAKAKPIEQFKKGDRLAYNYGEFAVVTSIKKATPKFHDVVTTYKGKTYTSRVKVGSYKPYFKRR